jgi:hypothetical protein
MVCAFVLANCRGGWKRNGLPSGIDRYYSVVRFCDTSEEVWQQGAWSFVVEFLEPPSTSAFTLAEVYYLFPNGPMDLFYRGSGFEVREGDRTVARGELLGDSLDDIAGYL